MVSMSNQLALHTSTLDTTPLAEVLRVARDTGWDAVELRRVDFDRAEAAGQSEHDVLELVRHSQLAVSAVGVAAGWMFAVGDERAHLLDRFTRSCFVANALDCPIVMSAGGSPVGRGFAVANADFLFTFLRTAAFRERARRLRVRLER